MSRRRVRNRLCAVFGALALTIGCVAATTETAGATRNPKPWCHPCKGETP